MTNQELVQKLISDKVLVTHRIVDAFKAVPRENFVLLEDKTRAYEDKALSIGCGATISQPTTVAIMLELLKPEPGNRILEIGTGSGYLTALLAEIAGDRGKVFSIECVADLKGLAEFNLRKYNFKNVALFVGDGKIGLKDYVFFDRIISSASGEEIPSEWKSQLAIGGRMVVPLKDNIVILDKISEKKFKEKRRLGFVFVPLR